MTTVDWRIELDPAAPGSKIAPAILGHYDLSGALFKYDPKLLAAPMKTAGFSEWRVGVGRWEISTLLLPTLSDGTACAPPEIPPLPKEAFAEPGATDLSLIAARDWFIDDGKPVTLPSTGDDARYSLGYVRAVIDTAIALGAKPYVDVDLMPRALSANKTPARVKGVIPDPCMATFTNKVSNVKPIDTDVFAAAVAGLVKRVVEGSGTEKGRPVTHFEIWNEPEFPYFWDKSFETKGLDDWFKMAATTLVYLASYRKGATKPEVKALKFGMGSFALADTAVTAIGAFDKTALPDGTFLPVDFISFHSYDNDPLKVADDIEKVAAARRTSTHYKDIEIALAEWGMQLDGKGWDAATMDQPLHLSTVIALGTGSSLDHAHRALFYDFYPGLPFGLLDHDGKPKPAYHAYVLLAEIIRSGTTRLAAKGFESGRLDGGQGVVLATKDDTGKIRVLLINRGSSPRTVEVAIAGAASKPNEVKLFDAPSSPPHSVDAKSPLTVPARSIALVTF